MDACTPTSMTTGADEAKKPEPVHDPHRIRLQMVERAIASRDTRLAVLLLSTP